MERTPDIRDVLSEGDKLQVRIIDIDSNDIIRSHCPTYMDTPYGSRTRIS